MANTRQTKRRKRSKPSICNNLYCIAISVAISTANLPLHLESEKINNNAFSNLPFAGVFAVDVSSTSASFPNSRQQRRQQQHRKTQVSVFPQEIFRLEEPTTTTSTTASVSLTSQNHQRGINRPPTPAPVAAATRPTPAPVIVERTTPAPVSRPTPQPVSPTSIDMTPQSASTSSTSSTSSSSSSSNNSATTKTTDIPKTQPPTPKPISPWADVHDQEFEIEIQPETNDGNNNNDNTPQQPSSPFFRDYCTNIRNQNHKAMLDKQEEGLAGPTYLYSVNVFVVYDETLLTKEEVPESLDILNVPVAMSVSGCESTSKRQLQQQQQEQEQSNSNNNDNNNSTTTSYEPAEVEYAEVESWRPSSETTLGCAPSPQIEGLVCNVFRSRVIVFLVDNKNATFEQRQEEYQTKIQLAFDAEKTRVTKNPGILALDIHTIENVALANANNDNSNSNNNNIIGAQSSNANNSSSWWRLSEKETLVVGSVAAGIGGLLIGMICMVRWRRSSRCANNQHLKMKNDEDDDDDSFDEEWSPPRTYTPSEIEQDLAETYVMKHRGDSMLLQLNRDNSLLDDPNARRGMGPKRGVTIRDRRTAQGWEDEFGNANNIDEYQDSPQRQSYFESAPCCSEERPCSAATCTLCENLRTSGIGNDEYLWLKELLPASPERVPSYDPNRPCLCSDTVEL